MNAKAIQRVEEDKRRRQQRQRVAAREAEERTEILERRATEQAAAKAEAERIAREQPIDDEVALRLKKLENKGDY